jgi:MscS family membrane protein
MITPARRHILVLFSLVLATLLPGQGSALADEAFNPLRPADTGSPRETLRGFLQTLNDTHASLLQIVESYFSSSRLYLTDEESAAVDRALEQVDLAKRTLDLSELPAALAENISAFRVLQLKEVLDRMDLPAFETIPDAEAMEANEFKRWTLPGSEITIARVEDGPRAGEYLFSAETVGRLPGFYRKVKHLSYKPGATRGWYENYRYGGAGLRGLVPYRWMTALPGWSKQRVLDQPLWRWFGVVLVLLAATGVYLLARRAADAWAKRDTGSQLRTQSAQLARPVILLTLIPLIVHALADNLRISGYVLEVTTLSLWAIFTLSLTWAVWLSAHVVAENIVSSQQMLTGSIDSQLVRLGLRLVATIVSVAVLVVGAQHLGIPAYSVIAGLGVGGVAVALAAKDSLANLLGSLLIMLEKPFRVGHWIKVEGTEGIVESIGFRSTRIRTFYDSLISIPSNQLVNSTVDNMALRKYRRVRTILHLGYDTPADRVEAFIEAIKQIIQIHPHTLKDRSLIWLDDFGEYGLHIVVNFFLDLSDTSLEKLERQKILLEILKLAESMAIQYVVPPLKPQAESSTG